MQKLAEALSAFTGQIKDAHKNAKGHNYRYADLPTILQLVRPLLAKHGLSVVQFPVSEGEQVGVRTILMHKSGESIEDRFLMTVSSMRGMSDAQAIGSTLTYFRRYAIAAALGISQEDDDGVSAPNKPEMATEEQKNTIVDYREKGILPKRREEWMKAKGESGHANWVTMTKSHAESIIDECRKIAGEAA